MKCEDIVELAHQGQTGLLDPHEQHLIAAHIQQCQSCRFAIIGAGATRSLKDRPVESAPDDLFARTMGPLRTLKSNRRKNRRNFWAGVGVGGSIAAALFAVVIGLGILGMPADPVSSEQPEFFVSVQEPRTLNIAIDADSAMADAVVSVSLIGGIALDGYLSRRHLSWTTDLEQGVNKLSLPIIALDQDGGQVVVRLEHPEIQREFLVELRHEG